MQIEKIEFDFIASMAGIPQDKIITDKLNEIIEVVNKLEDIRQFNEDRQIRMTQVVKDYEPICPPSSNLSVDKLMTKGAIKTTN